MFLIQSQGKFGFNRVDSSSVAASTRKAYESEGYRVVSELEYSLAGLITAYDAEQVARVLEKLAQETNDTPS